MQVEQSVTPYIGFFGGAMYFGGFLNDAHRQGGPNLGFYYRPWQLG